MTNTKRIAAVGEGLLKSVLSASFISKGRGCFRNCTLYRQGSETSFQDAPCSSVAGYLTVLTVPEHYSVR